MPLFSAKDDKLKERLERAVDLFGGSIVDEATTPAIEFLQMKLIRVAPKQTGRLKRNIYVLGKNDRKFVVIPRRSFPRFYPLFLDRGKRHRRKFRFIGRTVKRLRRPIREMVIERIESRIREL